MFIKKELMMQYIYTNRFFEMLVYVCSVTHSRREIQEVLNNVQQIHGKGERTLEKKLMAIRLEVLS